MKQKKSKKDMTFKERIVEGVKEFLSAYIIVFFIRLFLIEAFQIPSQSMVPNLLVKDILMVEKLTMGTKIPILNWKIKGFLKPKKNDIIVFISPAWESPGLSKELISLLTFSIINLDNTFETPKNLVKRLVAEPGDRISMSNHILFINGKQLETESIGIVKQPIIERFKYAGDATFHIYEENYNGKKRIVQYYAPFEKREDLEYKNAIQKLTNESLVDSFGFYREYLLSSFPEIYVPKKGDTIKIQELNSYNKYLIKLLIERETKKKIKISNGKFLLDGNEIKEWKIKENYYFGMGDNRHLSEDCRYFGFIPESNIFGKPLVRYWPLLRVGFDFNEKKKTIIKKYL
ncbi:MAG: signal peptidase I [Brevinematales bacterium]|nr:signal peptidase I [Brevinematales bacterium]